MKRILIVEDEAKLARLITGVLREEGYAAEAANDGLSGLARALAEDYDLLILDWMLPDRSGIQVVRGLRASSMGVPVLMLTARAHSNNHIASQLMVALQRGREGLYNKHGRERKEEIPRQGEG